MITRAPSSIYSRHTKRAIDVLVAGTLLLLLAPLLVFIGLLVVLVDGRPVFFTQTRPGLKSQPFAILKFRTMRGSVTGTTAQDDTERTSSLGRQLRRSSLDELPELWNVLKGEMSLVGPRPLLMEYLSEYNDHQSRRHDVRPGITGLAQVHGRNDLTRDEKVAYDLWYVDNVSFSLDVSIIIKTIGTVISHKGIDPQPATGSFVEH